MLKNISYKNKTRLLVAVFVLFGFAAYHLAIKKTIIAYGDFQQSSARSELVANVPLLTAQLEKQLTQMDLRIGTRNKNTQNRDQELLEFITNYCEDNDAVLKEFPQNTSFDQGDLEIETNRFVVQGNFSTLLQLTYFLEQKKQLGKVASVQYQVKKDLKSREMELTSTIYLQNFKKKHNEK
ncbi:MAG TPA: hypothetical protein VF868_01430 [Bacteroidia bacterium]|jgi:hypothetical protein